MTYKVFGILVFSLLICGNANAFLPFLDHGKVDVPCLECHAVVEPLLLAVQSGASLEELEQLAVDVCLVAHLFTPDVCWQMVYLSAPEVVYILNNTLHNLDTICYTFFHTCENHMSPWYINSPAGKPPGSHPDPVPEGPMKLRILHISDPHYEPMYVEGTPTECEHPLCCRAYNDSVSPDAPLAGRYGAESGDCDPPLVTLEAALAASATLAPDLVYITGDLPPHDVWAQTHDSIVGSVRENVLMIKSYFPDVPVIHSVGNHESAPVNSFSVPLAYNDGWTMDWLYNELEQVWMETGLPSEAVGTTVRAGGYFSWSPTPGLRVVVLNSNYGFYQNWWMLIDHIDPTGQLLWLAEVLTEAERSGEKVHILQHHAPDGLLDSWSHAFNTLISRFESTVTGIFVGHSHDDHFHVLWDVEDNTRPVAMTYVCPSLSSNGYKSPSFRLYEVDGGYENATWTVLETFTYSMNLTEANAGAAPDFPLAYTASEAYSLPSLAPASWAAAVWDMATNDVLFHEYIRHLYSFWAEPEELETCDTDCRRSELCDMYSGDSTDSEPCERVMAQVPNSTSSTTALY